MKFITGLPSLGGYTIIFVVINKLSKNAHFSPLKTNYSSKLVVETFVTVVVKLHGFPKTIVSDREVLQVSFGNIS